MVEVLVEFDYAAREPDELTIKNGDIIKDVTQKPGGWWEGTLRDKKGMFPDNFVKVLEKDAVVLRNKKDSSRIRQCRVVFSYNQDHEDELNLKVGDVINIIGEEEEGWWRGVLNGKEGVFPSNFVEEITPPQNLPKPSTRDDLARISDPVPALPAKPVKQFCEVCYSYKAQSKDELTLKEGDIITILNKDCEDPGWWKGEVNGKIGLFPDNFVSLLPQGSDDKKPIASIKQFCEVCYSYKAQSKDELTLKEGDIITILNKDCEDPGWWKGEVNGKIGLFPDNFVSLLPQGSDDKQPIASIKQFCEVRYSYKAQNEDELTLKEGDIVTILNKDCQDPGWWKGEVNGKIGVFPDNFVLLLPQGSDDKKPIASSKIENKSPADPSAIKPSSIASQRKSLELRNAQAKPPDTKTTPPLPGKKPIISIKKSPSGSGSGLFSKLKDKIVDAVDGATGSKPKTDVAKEAKENNVENSGSNASAFDQVERRPLLSDVRANRARAPGRRLPTAIHKDDEEDIPSLPNGTSDYIKSEIKSEDSFRSEGSASSENLDISSDLDANEVKPKLREWEKHKAPWLEEMKLNQAKRTSVSPVPEPKPKSYAALEPKPEPEVSKSSQNSPAEKEVNLMMDMSKSMSDIKVSPIELKPIPKPYKTPPNELDKAPPIKSKPVVPSVSSVNRHPIGSNQPPRESPSRTGHLPQPVKISAKPKPEQYENVIPQKPHGALSNITGFSSYSTSHTSHSSNVSSHTVSEKTIFSTTAALAGSTESSSSTSSSSSNKLEGTVSIVKFNEVLERLARLETKCEKQGMMIEDLKNRLQVEAEMRMILQEKIMHNNVQV